MNHPYWTREFIGLGPYRLSQWEPGAFLEGTAFEAHTWGRPKIDRVKLTFIADPNTALANLLAGEVILSADDSIRYQEGATLRRQWGPTGGSVLISPSLWRQTSFQHRPELARPAEIRDPRVRKALAFAVDRESLNQALFDGEAILADSPIPPGNLYDADLARLERPAFDPVARRRSWRKPAWRRARTACTWAAVDAWRSRSRPRHPLRMRSRNPCSRPVGARSDSTSTRRFFPPPWPRTARPAQAFPGL